MRQERVERRKDRETKILHMPNITSKVSKFEAVRIGRFMNDANLDGEAISSICYLFAREAMIPPLLEAEFLHYLRTPKHSLHFRGDLIHCARKDSFLSWCC